MKIVLEENDSFIQPDNIATMIVVAVTKDDGKVVRFPYAAEKSMSALIQDINAKIGNATASLPRVVEVSGSLETASPVSKIPDAIRQLAGTEGKIQREDLVKCIMVDPSRTNMKGQAPTIDIEVGAIYRVLKVIMNGPNVASYEVVDDTDYHKAEIPRRIVALPNEVEFFEKRKPPMKKDLGRFEEIFPCPNCSKNVVCYKMDDDKYHGSCECGQPIISDTVRKPVVQTA
jgi:hypothetical protein